MSKASDDLDQCVSQNYHSFPKKIPRFVILKKRRDRRIWTRCGAQGDRNEKTAQIANLTKREPRHFGQSMGGIAFAINQRDERGLAAC